MRTVVVLKNGFRFQGTVLSETETELILDEVKLGRTTVAKSAIAVRSGGGQ
jgi:hypothetical protein